MPSINDAIEVGHWYRLYFPGTFVRVIYHDDRNTYPYLVESLVLRSRWWVDGVGRPNNHMSPAIRVKRS